MCVCVFFVCLYLRWTGGFVEHFERNAKAYQSSWEQAYFSQNTPYDRFYQCGCFSHQQENNLRPVSSNGVRCAWMRKHAAQSDRVDGWKSVDGLPGVGDTLMGKLQRRSIQSIKDTVCNNVLLLDRVLESSSNSCHDIWSCEGQINTPDVPTSRLGSALRSFLVRVRQPCNNIKKSFSA